MKRPKLMMAASAIRLAGVDRLRAKLDELQAMSDAGDRRPEVYNTFVAITNEIERRNLRRSAKPVSLISKGASKTMRIGDIRAKIAELAQQEQTEIVRNTIAILSEETGRRSMLAKRTYWRRKSEAKAFLEGHA